MSSESIVSILGLSEPFSSLSHLSTALIFCFFAINLIRHGYGNNLRTLSLLIYLSGAIYLFLMSGIYHLLEPGGVGREVFQRLDHSGIWMMIAGTFTPIHVILFRGLLRWGVLILIWTIAISGLVLEVVFFKDFPEWLSLLLYLSLGWFGMITCFYYKKIHNQKFIKLIIYGGLSYSIGAIIEFVGFINIIPGIIGPHEFFHIATIIGAISHARFIYLIADVYIKERLTLLVKDRGPYGYYVSSMGERIVFKASNKTEIYQKIAEIISKNYYIAHKPKLVRLKYQEEEFFHTDNSEGSPNDGDLFHQSNVYVSS